MIDRGEALELLKKYVDDDKIIKHSLAVEAIMAEMAKELEKDEDRWRITGLLHDLDYKYTKDDPKKHTYITAQILEGLVSEQILDAIKAHNYKHTDVTPTNTLDKALIAADAISGLIIATALVMPSKKLSEVRVKSLIKKFKDNSFAKGCDRDRIEISEDLGFELEEFLSLSLRALQGISDKLDL